MSQPTKARIVATPGVCGGRPRVDGTRITVADLLAALGAGDSIDELVDDFPELTRDGIFAALQYAAGVLGNNNLAA